MNDRSLHYYCQPQRDITSNRDEQFPLKNLDFMSVKEACNIVGDVMNQMDINVIDYNVYPVDFNYIDSWDKEQRAMEWYDDTDEIFRIIQHSKDDEMYVIVPRIGLPNGSLLAEMSYNVPFDTPSSNYIEFNSGKVYAVVGKDGVWNFSGDGVFDVTAEEKVEDIVSFDAALDVIVDSYRDLRLKETKIYKAEFSYIPEIVDAEAGIYELKPYWVFNLTRELTEDYGTQYLIRHIDAITGEEVTFLE